MSSFMYEQRGGFTYAYPKRVRTPRGTWIWHVMWGETVVLPSLRRGRWWVPDDIQ